MAISTSLPIALSTVLTEVGLSPTGSSLVAADTASIAGGFNPTYGAKGDKTLQSFRGYSHVCVAGLKSIAFYPTATTSGSACSPVGGEQLRYHNGAGTDPANGDKLYVDSGGCTVMNGGGSWFAMRNGGTFWKCTVSSTGIVGSKTLCP